MALTVKKIKDRVLDSLNQAKVMKKIEEGKKVTSEELEAQKLWKSHFYGTKRSSNLQLIPSQEESNQLGGGFIF